MRLFADTLYPLLPPLLVWTLAVRRAAARWWLPASLAGALALAILRKATNWINNEYVTLAVMAAGLALATRIAFGLA
ncbi:MAG: hypothetical protein LBQ92_00605, partial [Propionibacteriaceae bacterium]|nr:hypothetical protein [Propionibacteriaceae bacterium]